MVREGRARRTRSDQGGLLRLRHTNNQQANQQDQDILDHTTRSSDINRDINSFSNNELEHASIEKLIHRPFETLDFKSIPGRAYDFVEDFSRYLWRTVPGLSVDKAEELSKNAWKKGPLLAYDKVEEFASHLWEAVPDMPLERADAIAGSIWESFFVKYRCRMEEWLRDKWEVGREVIHHSHLPKWLRDNDYLVKGHRPPLRSFAACFRSIFRIHTETGNIWTHLLGCIFFIFLTSYFWSRPSVEVVWEKKLVFSAFFAGTILCLSFSSLFHCCCCHSEKVGRIFAKLDYCGIALLIVGSFVPWLYYCFYCHNSPRVVYLVCIFVLGILSIIVSMWDKFGQPQYRSLRAGVFVALGLSGVVPAAHYILWEGFYHAWNMAAMSYLFLMAFLYIFGAFLYAARIPECIWPGKFDYLFQSHQIFHVFVVAAAIVHFLGIVQVSHNHVTAGLC